MRTAFHNSGKLNWLISTLYFFRKHFAVIMGLALIAALGRVIQLGGFGAIQSWMNIVLEIVIESARILIFLYVLGLASIKSGALRIRSLFTKKNKRKILWTTAIQKLKTSWLPFLLNITGFLIITTVINYLIDLLAYETCFYLNLKNGGVLADATSEWTILLFAKNLSVIPFMLVFEAIFFLWITNRLQIRVGSKHLK